MSKDRSRCLKSAVEQRSVRLTQCAVESTSVPIAQFGNEQRSIPMPQSADGQLSVPVTDCAVGPKSGKRLQRLDRFTWRCHARQAEVCGSARNRVLGVDLGRNNQRPSTAPADVGVLPIPVEARINFPVIPGDAAETQEHSSSARHAEKQQNGDGVSRRCNGTRMFQNPSKADAIPKRK